MNHLDRWGDAGAAQVARPDLLCILKQAKRATSAPRWHAGVSRFGIRQHANVPRGTSAIDNGSTGP